MLTPFVLICLPVQKYIQLASLISQRFRLAQLVALLPEVVHCLPYRCHAKLFDFFATPSPTQNQVPSSSPSPSPSPPSATSRHRSARFLHKLAEVREVLNTRLSHIFRRIPFLADHPAVSRGHSRRRVPVSRTHPSLTDSPANPLPESLSVHHRLTDSDAYVDANFVQASTLLDEYEFRSPQLHSFVVTTVDRRVWVEAHTAIAEYYTYLLRVAADAYGVGHRGDDACDPIANDTQRPPLVLANVELSTCTPRDSPFPLKLTNTQDEPHVHCLTTAFRLVPPDELPDAVVLLRHCVAAEDWSKAIIFSMFEARQNSAHFAHHEAISILGEVIDYFNKLGQIDPNADGTVCYLMLLHCLSPSHYLMMSRVAFYRSSSRKQCFVLSKCIWT